MMLAYHELASKDQNDVYALSVEIFCRHIQQVGQCHGKQQAVSFDDGHISNYELALPVLKEFTIPAIFFVTTCWVDLLGSVMTWPQLRELAAQGHIIGSHTHTHALLTTCGRAALRN